MGAGADATTARSGHPQGVLRGEGELPAGLVDSVIEQRCEFGNIFKTAVAQHLEADSATLPTTPTIFMNICLGTANWTCKWFDPGRQRRPADPGSAHG